MPQICQGMDVTSPEFTVTQLYNEGPQCSGTWSYEGPKGFRKVAFILAHLSYEQPLGICPHCVMQFLFFSFSLGSCTEITYIEKKKKKKSLCSTLQMHITWKHQTFSLSS